MAYSDSRRKWLVNNFPGVESLELNGEFRGEKHSHILRKKDEYYKLWFGLAKTFCLDADVESFKPHQCAHHLNSSQNFCVNFFQPLRDVPEFLLQMFVEILHIPLKGKITKPDTRFEKVGEDATNFDFYARTTNDEHIYVEVKYTECSFGSKPKKLRDEFYCSWLQDSLYLKKFALNTAGFYKYYQIYRNISYIRSKCDYVVFLYPRGNITLSGQIRTAQIGDFPNVKIAYSEDLCSKIADLAPTDSLRDHFIRLRQTYFGTLTLPSNNIR